MSLLEGQYGDLPLDETPMQTYLHSIPMQFYPLASLLLVPLIGLLGLDYGPMRQAEWKTHRLCRRLPKPTSARDMSWSQ